MFKIGDLVERTFSSDILQMGGIYKVTSVDGSAIYLEGQVGSFNGYSFKLAKGDEVVMNSKIAEVFTATKDAVLVDRHFGSEIDSFTMGLILEANHDVYLAEAKRREEAKKNG